jgi:hypothetical protein
MTHGAVDAKPGADKSTSATTSGTPERRKPGCVFRSLVWGGVTLLLLRLTVEGAARAWVVARERTTDEHYIQSYVTAGALAGPLFTVMLVGLLALFKPARNERTLGVATLLILLFLNAGQCALAILRQASGQ